jgi:hypothetical protein
MTSINKSTDLTSSSTFLLNAAVNNKISERQQINQAIVRILFCLCQKYGNPTEISSGSVVPDG